MQTCSFLLSSQITARLVSVVFVFSLLTITPRAWSPHLRCSQASLPKRASCLGVVILDALGADVIGAAAAGASATAPAPAVRDAVVPAAHAEAEEHGGDEEGGPRAPGEAEGVPADRGIAAIVLECVASLDEGRSVL